MHRRPTTKWWLAMIPLLAVAVVMGGVGAPVLAQQPVTISVIDVAGDLSSVQVILDNYKKAFPNKVKEIRTQRAPEPELPAKIKAQQDAGRLDVNLIMTGQSAASQLISAGQLVKLLPTYDAMFPRDELTDAGKALQDEAEGYLMPSVVSNGGPVFIYNPKKVANPPKTAEQLLAWAKANPAKFLYARPANSGPGRSILAGMPYILKDRDPKDPEKGWDKTWAFLKELGQSMEYYPTGTAFTLKEFAQDQRWMIAGIMEWDMKPRAEGIIPPASKVTILDHPHVVHGRHRCAIPKGVAQGELEVLLDLIKFMRRPEQQVLTWRAFIGPSIKAATLDKAPPDLQKYVKEIWRPEYDEIGKKWKVTPMLEVKKLNYAIDRWDKEVGAQKIKKQ